MMRMATVSYQDDARNEMSRQLDEVGEPVGFLDERFDIRRLAAFAKALAQARSGIAYIVLPPAEGLDLRKMFDMRAVEMIERMNR